ncbi:YitT family protein [Bacteroidota bacterium]
MNHAVIVLLGLVAFGDWKIPLYSWLTIFITGKVIDATLNGANYNRSVFIISEKYADIQKFIINNLNRGGTVLKGQGLFDETDKPVVFTNVSRRELVMLENHIKEIDEDAFLTIMDAKEILGNGFKPLNEA